MKILEITWIDAEGADGWVSKKEIVEQRKLAVITSVGYLLAEDDKSITITMADDPKNSNCGAYMVIPKITIKKKRLLK